MRIAALILGIIGGVFGLVGGFFALTVGGIGSAVGGKGAGTVIGLGFTAILISLLAIIAGALAMKFPRFSGWTMIICAVAGVIAVSMGYMLAAPLLLVGGVLALVSAKQKAAEPTAA